MELNLKKARKLEAKIQNYLDTTPIRTATVNVRVLGSVEDAKAVIKKGNEETRTVLHDHISLLEARFYIRRQIEKQNEANGIHQLMNDRALLLKVIEENNKVISETLSDEDLKDTLKIQSDALKNPDSYGNRNYVNVGVFTKEELEFFLDFTANTKRKIEDIEDLISQKNLSSKIVLSEDAIKLLQSKRLL